MVRRHGAMDSPDRRASHPETASLALSCDAAKHCACPSRGAGMVRGWLGDHEVKLMLPVGEGVIVIRGTLPDVGPSLREQEIMVKCGEVSMKTTVRVGDFEIL